MAERVKLIEQRVDVASVRVTLYLADSAAPAPGELRVQLLGEAVSVDFAAAEKLTETQATTLATIRQRLIKAGLDELGFDPEETP